MLTNINLPIAITFDSEQAAETFMVSFTQIVPKAKVTVINSVPNAHQVVIYTRKDKAFNELVGANFVPNAGNVNNS